MKKHCIARFVIMTLVTILSWSSAISAAVLPSTLRVDCFIPSIGWHWADATFTCTGSSSNPSITVYLQPRLFQKTAPNEIVRDSAVSASTAYSSLYAKSVSVDYRVDSAYTLVTARARGVVSGGADTQWSSDTVGDTFEWDGGNGWE